MMLIQIITAIVTTTILMIVIVNISKSKSNKK